MKAKAYELISQVNGYLTIVQTLPESDRYNLIIRTRALQTAVANEDMDEIRETMNALRTNYEYLSALYPPPITDDGGGE